MHILHIKIGCRIGGQESWHLMVFEKYNDSIYNLVAQGTRRLPHASEGHESANRSGRRPSAGRGFNGIIFMILARVRHSGLIMYERMNCIKKIIARVAQWIRHLAPN